VLVLKIPMMLSNPINIADTFSCKIITIEPQGGKKQNTRAFVEARSKPITNAIEEDYTKRVVFTSVVQ
jgi:hypothetical protein